MSSEHQQPPKPWYRRFVRPAGLLASPTETNVPPVHETSAQILAKTTLPDPGPVTLEDISIYRLPVDLMAVKRMGTLINQIKNVPYEGSDFSHLKPDESVYTGIVPTASVIAHQFYPQIPEIMLSNTEVEAMKPWLGEVSQFIGGFSGRLQERFRRFIEKSAKNQVREAANNIIVHGVRPLVLLGQVERPKEQFVNEVSSVYKGLATTEMTEEGWFFDATPKSIETKMYEFMWLLPQLRDGHTVDWRDDTISRKNYPLLARVLQGFNVPSFNMTDSFWTDSIAGAEMMSGIRTFLTHEKVGGLPAAPEPSPTIDPWDPDTWSLDIDSISRSVAEWYDPAKIARVKSRLPSILVEAKNILPESGPELVNAVRELSLKVLILSKEGYSNAELAAALFKKPGVPTTKF